MNKKYKIAVLGIGGIGGYFGGKLAGHYANDTDVDIIFFARGENEKAIRLNGLKLITTESEETVYPAIVTGKPETVGVVNIILCCVKSYDLGSSLAAVRPCVDANTIFLPFLNGADISERIKNAFPKSRIWSGCVYIFSQLVSPGVIKESGKIAKLFFGSSAEPRQTLEQVEKLFSSAGINACLADDISQTIWEKFLFISPMATLTSCLDLTIGDIINNATHKQSLVDLLLELERVALANNILLPEDCVQKTLDKIASLPPQATSSMHRDFTNGNKTEVESLTGYVVRLGQKLKISTPNYNKMLEGLNSKINTRTE